MQSSYASYALGRADELGLDLAELTASAASLQGESNAQLTRAQRRLKDKESRKKSKNSPVVKDYWTDLLTN